jgi:lipopolysaccharide export system permease protein
MMAEQVVSFVVSIFVMTIVIFLGRSLRYTSYLFAGGGGLTDFFTLLLYSLPYIFSFTLPMATLIAVLVTFSRLSLDNEITAMKAAGISFYQMIPPVAVLTGFASLATLALSAFILPRGDLGIQRTILAMVQSRVQFALKERVFNSQFDGLVFFINEISADGSRMQGIFINDERSPEMTRTIVAEEGSVLNQPEEKQIVFKLLRGTMIRVNETMSEVQTINFRNYDFRVDLGSLGIGGETFAKGARHMDIIELRNNLRSVQKATREYYSLLLEYHKRLSLPFACLVLGFLAAPLGVQAGSASRLKGVVMGLVLFLLYYVCVSAGSALGEDGTVPPAISMWLPVVFFAILGIVMWIKTARESSLKVVTLLGQLRNSVISWLRVSR